MQFRLAYVAPESRVVGTGDLVDEPMKIAMRYLRGFFVLDLFVVLPLPQVLYALFTLTYVCHIRKRSRFELCDRWVCSNVLFSILPSSVSTQHSSFLRKPISFACSYWSWLIYYRWLAWFGTGGLLFKWAITRLIWPG